MKSNISTPRNQSRKNQSSPREAPLYNTSPTDSVKNFSLLSGLDLKQIEAELDPSVADGHRIVFEKEIPIDLRTQQDNSLHTQEEGALEAVRCKILVSGEENNYKNIKLELTSENDLFFHFNHFLDRDGYTRLQQVQKLMVEFDDYPKVLSKMFLSCAKEPECFLCIFVMHNNGTGQLSFVQNMEYKFVELLAIDFKESSEKAVRSHISYRYNTLRSRLALLQQRLQDLSSIVKLKNPSLHLQLQRSSTPLSSPQPIKSSSGHGIIQPSPSKQKREKQPN